MSELDLCHWILLEPNGACRNVIAPSGESFEDYIRVGACASSHQFVFPLVFAVHSESNPLQTQEMGPSTLFFNLHRDDKTQPGPAFADMDPVKVVMLLSELSKCMAEWVEAVGCGFRALQIDDSNDRGIKLTYNLEASLGSLQPIRALLLIKAGLKMMAFARGLKVEFLGA